jgi:hypothetical protein
MQTTDLKTAQKAKKKQLDMQFDPQETSLDKPKHGQEDPSGGAHSGGNTFAGGVRYLWWTCGEARSYYVDWWA